MKQTQLVCVACPVGCAMTVQFGQDGTIETVTGNACKRGISYAQAEVTKPVRSLTTTMRVKGGALPLVPVKAEKPVPKELQKACVSAISQKSAQAPISIGDVLLKDLLGTGIDVIATGNCARG